MPNQTYALEWLDHAKRHLDTARLLFRENHYTDIISLEIHQTIEKALKAMYAYYGKTIPRTHILTTLFKEVESWISLEYSVDELIVISDYYESERYPGRKGL